MSDIGAFEKLLASGQFAVTAELSPPDSADPEEVYSRAQHIALNSETVAVATGDLHDSRITAALQKRAYGDAGHVAVRPRTIRGRAITTPGPLSRIQRAARGELSGPTPIRMAHFSCKPRSRTRPMYSFNRAMSKQY